MSNGTLENISILDLPAFGAIVPTFRQDLTKQFNWPIEINYALFTRNKGSNMTEVFTEYKNLMEDWGHHMEQLGRNSDVGYWTPEMKNNRHLNFTNFIKDDMKTFLMSISGKNILKYLQQCPEQRQYLNIHRDTDRAIGVPKTFVWPCSKIG